jgi:hypothetical protein
MVILKGANKMNKHTPGEWIGKATGAGQGLIYAEKDGRNVAVAYHARDTDLIAAAPDMLEALQAWTEFSANKNIPFGLISQTRLAIAKAEGRE